MIFSMLFSEKYLELLTLLSVLKKEILMKFVGFINFEETYLKIFRCHIFPVSKIR